MRKKILGLLLFACIFLTSCNSAGMQNIIDGQVVEQEINTIQVMSLSEEQEEIKELLSVDRQIELFSFRCDNYECVDVWIEVYENGELIDEINVKCGLRLEKGVIQGGKIALAIDQSPDFQWTITLADKNDNKTSITSLPCTYYTDAYSNRTMSNAIDIHDGEEIALYATYFSGDSKMEFVEEEELITPELLERYSHIHIVKCKFF